MTNQDWKDYGLSATFGLISGVCIGGFSTVFYRPGLFLTYAGLDSSNYVAFGVGLSAITGIIALDTIAAFAAEGQAQSYCDKARPSTFWSSFVLAMGVTALSFNPYEYSDQNTHLSNHDNVTRVIQEVADIPKVKTINYTLAPMAK